MDLGNAEADGDDDEDALVEADAELLGSGDALLVGEEEGL